MKNNNQPDEGSVKRFEYHLWVKGTILKDEIRKDGTIRPGEKKLRYHPYTRLDFKFDYKQNK